MPAQRFQDVVIWKKAHEWVLEIYRFTEKFPRHEQFGLTSQLRRAAVSIPANFAEGFRKQSKIDKMRFFNIAQGSLSESQYYLLLANDLNYGQSDNLINQLTQIDLMLDAYIRKIREEVGRRS